MTSVSMTIMTARVSQNWNPGLTAPETQPHFTIYCTAFFIPGLQPRTSRQASSSGSQGVEGAKSLQDESAQPLHYGR